MAKFKPKEEDIKKFVEEFGFTQKEIKETEGFKGGNCAVIEMAINFGYVWIEKYKVWIRKNNAFYSDYDELIVEYLRENE